MFQLFLVAILSFYEINNKPKNETDVTLRQIFRLNLRHSTVLDITDVTYIREGSNIVQYCFTLRTLTSLQVATSN